MPTGGVIDTIAPKAAKATPNDNSTNFNTNTFSVEFDEFIELDNVSQKLLISPPLNSRPEVGSTLNKLTVRWSDTLQSNTTYIFDFADAIKDFTEGNKIGNFSYSLSTGDFIDSLSYIGKVVDAYTLKPINDKFAMLYDAKKGKDIIRTEKPSYITRLDTFGVFRFRNLAAGEYNLIVLDDKNQNLIYDLPTEAIAFSSKPVEPFILKDSVIKTDSLPTFFFFEPKDTTISIENKTLLSDRKLRLIFSNPVSDSFHITLSNGDTNILNVFSAKRDTLTCYAVGEKTFDTLKAEVSDGGFEEKIELYYLSKRKSSPAQTFAIPPPNRDLNYFDKLRLDLPFPCEKDIKVKASIICDSVTDTILLTSKEMFLESEDLFQAGKAYKLFIDSSTFANVIGQTNDSLSCIFSVTKPEDYGKISITIAASGKLIVILETLQGKELATKQAEGNTKVVFDNVKEDKYRIKVIIDSNANDKWDIGDFDIDCQPEIVKYFDKTINVRKNWEIEESWTIEDAIP
jgi:uncharacterized protein (DUF2141 family)